MLFERTLKDGQSDIQFNPKAEKISAAAKEMISVNCLKIHLFCGSKSGECESSNN